jgi:hypothetical protein
MEEVAEAECPGVTCMCKMKKEEWSSRGLETKEEVFA